MTGVTDAEQASAHLTPALIVERASKYFDGLTYSQIASMLNPDSYLVMSADHKHGFGVQLDLVQIDRTDETVHYPGVAGYFVITVYWPEDIGDRFGHCVAFPLREDQMNVFRFMRGRPDLSVTFQYYGDTITIAVQFPMQLREHLAGIAQYCEQHNGLSEASTQLLDDLELIDDVLYLPTIQFPSQFIGYDTAVLQSPSATTDEGILAEDGRREVVTNPIDNAVDQPDGSSATTPHVWVIIYTGRHGHSDLTTFYPYTLSRWQHLIMAEVYRNMEAPITPGHVTHEALGEEERLFDVAAVRIGDSDMWYFAEDVGHGVTRLRIHLLDVCSFCTDRRTSPLDDRREWFPTVGQVIPAEDLVRQSRQYGAYPTIYFVIDIGDDGNMLKVSCGKGWAGAYVPSDAEHIEELTQAACVLFVDHGQIRPLMRSDGHAGMFADLSLLLNAAMAQYFALQNQDTPFLLMNRMIFRDGRLFSARLCPTDFLILLAVENLLYWDMNSYSYTRHDDHYLDSPALRGVDLNSVWLSEHRFVRECNQYILAAIARKLEVPSYIGALSHYKTRDVVTEYRRLALFRILYNYRDVELKQRIVNGVIQVLRRRGLYNMSRQEDAGDLFSELISGLPDVDAQIRTLAALFGFASLMVGDTEREIVTVGRLAKYTDEMFYADAVMNNTLQAACRGEHQPATYLIERIGGEDHAPTFCVIGEVQIGQTHYQTDPLVIVEGSADKAKKVAAMELISVLQSRGIEIAAYVNNAIVEEDMSKVVEAAAQGVHVTEFTPFEGEYIGGTDYMGQLINGLKNKAQVVILPADTAQIAGEVENISGIGIVVEGTVIAVYKLRAISAKEARRRAAFIALQQHRDTLEMEPPKEVLVFSNARNHLNHLEQTRVITDVRWNDVPGVNGFTSTVTITYEGKERAFVGTGGKKKDAQEAAAQQLVAALNH